MKIAILFLPAAIAFGQAPFKVVATGTAGTPPSMYQSITAVEKRLDAKVDQVGSKDGRVYVLGLTRGLYLAGYGAVFTQELDLIQTPHPTPFHIQITADEAAKVHQHKQENLAALRNAMRDMWADAVAALPKLADTDQVVLAVRLLYQPWENTAGLPVQIVVKGPRTASPATLQIEEQ
ncbi:MAG: hypothetical protein JOZ22_02810 [Acidobacteriia bacterium]|nr:hypothetical protein [Terriglobia bacterium]